MNLKNTLLGGVILLTLLISGCGGDEETEIPMPSNLQFTTTIDGADIEVTATAENAKYYSIAFGDGTTIQTDDGVASHTYLVSGTYTITVNALATSTKLITSTKKVTIDIPISNEGYVSATSREGYDLVWEEEFSADALNESIWNYEIGTGSGGWGNNELQYYRKENTALTQGFLVITAKKEPFSGSQYTSSRLTTQNKKTFTFGRIDIRARVPRGQGIWPALWMLGANISTVGWPACGEIDIMEMIGGSGREKTVHGTVHWYAENGYANYGGPRTLTTGTYADEFFVYSIEWDEEFIKWYVNDEFFHQIDIRPEHLSEFRNPHFFIVNLAVGGNWPQSPDGTTVFPQQLIVDYIRVFQKP